MKHDPSSSVPARTRERRKRPWSPRVGAPAAALAVLLAACAGPSGEAGRPSPGPPGEASVEWAGLRFRLSLIPSPRNRIRLGATVSNVSDGVREAELPWCLLQVRLYRDGELAFDQSAADRCGEAVRVVRLRRGHSRRFRRTLSAAEVLGDSLRPGRYEVRARIPGNTGRRGPPRAPMEFALGTVELRRP